MKKQTILPFLIMAAFAVSCSNTSEKVINKANISEDYKALKERGVLSGRQDSVLMNLANLAMGRSAYISNNDIDDKSAKMLVGADKFEDVTDELFSGLEKDQITYGQLLNDVAKIEERQNQFDNQLDSLRSLLADRCMAIQSEIDSTSQALSDLIDFKLVGIKSGTYKYEDYVQVDLKATNNSGERVEAISFKVKILDKLNEEITTLICSSSTPFSSSTTLSYSYEEHDFDRRDIYKALEQTTMRRVGGIEQEISKVNLGGTVYGNDRMNFKYTREENGYCPYIDKDDELNQSIEKTNMKSAELVKESKVYSRIMTATMKLFDFNSLLNG